MILNSPYISGSLTVTGNEVVTGSLTVLGGITGAITGSATSASFATNASFLNGLGSGEFVPTGSFNTFSSSILTYTGSANSRLSSLETTSGSNITRIAALETASGSAISRLSSLETTSGSNITRLSSLEARTGSYATTGSNTFDGGAYFSSSFNPTGFSTTASLYTDGGLRVTRDAYISGTLYLNNVTVFGTQSVAYISSSQLNIGTNLITVNTDTPSIRFGGLAVYDSGSTGLTGSILWDSQNNHWVYSNPSGSSYSGGMFISGPRTSTLGSETGTTSCMLMAGQGGDHITSSMIYHSSTVTCFYNNATIDSSGIGYFNRCLTVGSLTGSGYRLEAINPSCTTGYVDLFYGLHTGNNTITIKQFGASHPSAAAVNQIGVLNAEQHLYLVTDDLATINAGTSTRGIFIKSGGRVGIGMQSPSEKLEICGALKINGQLCSTGISSNSTYIDQASGTARLLSYGPNSTTRGSIAFFQASSTNACQFTSLTLDPSGNAIFGGNVGIGCSDPGYKLDISSSGCIVNIETVGTYNNGTNLRIYRLQDNNNSIGKALHVCIRNSGSPDNVTMYGLYLDASVGGGNNNKAYGLYSERGTTVFGATSGYVGIGATNPNAPLHVCNSTTITNISIENTNASGYAVYQAKTTCAVYTWQWGSWNDGTYRIGQSGVGDYITVAASGISKFLCQVCAPRITINSGTSGIIDLGQIDTGGVANQIVGGQYSGYAYVGKLSFNVGTWGAGSDYGPTEQMRIEVQGADTKKSQITMAPYGGSIISCGDSYFCGSTYGIMGFGCKVFDKVCHVMTTSGTICLPLDGLIYGSGPTRAIYIYGTLLGNDALHYAHLVYFYRNDYGGLMQASIAQASCVHPSTAGQPYTFSVNDPGGLDKSTCTVRLRLTSAGAGVAPGSYCTQLRIVVYNIPG